MPNVLELKQQAAELNREVQTKIKDCESGAISVADFSQYMENAGVRDAEIASGIKAFNEATRISGATGSFIDGIAGDPALAGNPPAPQLDWMTKNAQENAATFKRLAECAQANIANKGSGRGSFSFDIPMKMADPFEVIMKAQGAAGVQGVNASGTTAPPTGVLPVGQYFPTGPAGPTVEPEFLPGIRELKFYPNVVAGLFSSYPVSGPIVSYVKETAWNNASAATPEGATKPTSTNTVKRYTETIGKITNLSRVTDELIQDAAYFWALVQNRGVQGVTRKEEIELLAGAGVPSVLGLLQRTAVNAGLSYPSGFTALEVVAPLTNVVIGGAPGAGASSTTIASVTPGRKLTTTPTGAGVEIAEAILQAITDLRLTQFIEPDNAVLNPVEWQKVRLAKDQNGQYLGGSFFGTNYGNAQNAGSTGIQQGLTLWDKNVVTTPVQPQGLTLVGAFADGGQVLRRGGMRVDVTNTNGFDFEQNLWTARFEERLGLLVDFPEYFVLTQVV
jgi:HK97 family phage major capsid protein